MWLQNLIRFAPLALDLALYMQLQIKSDRFFNATTVRQDKNSTVNNHPIIKRQDRGLDLLQMITDKT